MDLALSDTNIFFSRPCQCFTSKCFKEISRLMHVNYYLSVKIVQCRFCCCCFTNIIVFNQNLRGPAISFDLKRKHVAIRGQQALRDIRLTVGFEEQPDHTCHLRLTRSSLSRSRGACTDTDKMPSLSHSNTSYETYNTNHS